MLQPRLFRTLASLWNISHTASGTDQHVWSMSGPAAAHSRTHLNLPLHEFMVNVTSLATKASEQLSERLEG